MALVEGLAARGKRASKEPIKTLKEAQEELPEPESDYDPPDDREKEGVGDMEWNKNIPWWMVAAAFAPEAVGAGLILKAVAEHVLRGIGTSYTGTNMPQGTQSGNVYIFDATKKYQSLRPGGRRGSRFGGGGRGSSWTYYPGEPM